MDGFDPFTLPPGFDPLDTAQPPPPPRRRAPAATARPAAPAPPAEPADPMAALDQRLAAVEAALATLTARLEATDGLVTERLNDQMGRLVRTVAGMLEW
jgi:hypothetical protein